MTPQIHPNKTSTNEWCKYEDNLWVIGPSTEPISRARTVDFDVTDDIEAYINVNVRQTETGSSAYDIVFQIYVNVNNRGWQRIFKDRQRKNSEEDALEFAISQTQRIVEEPTVSTFVDSVEDEYIQ